MFSRTVVCCRELHIIHTDLKPENVMLTEPLLARKPVTVEDVLARNAERRTKSVLSGVQTENLTKNQKKKLRKKLRKAAERHSGGNSESEVLLTMTVVGLAHIDWNIWVQLKSNRHICQNCCTLAYWVRSYSTQSIARNGKLRGIWARCICWGCWALPSIQWDVWNVTHNYGQWRQQNGLWGCATSMPLTSEMSRRWGLGAHWLQDSGLWQCLLDSQEIHVRHTDSSI